MHHKIDLKIMCPQWHVSPCGICFECINHHCLYLRRDVFLDVFEVTVEFGMIKDRAISHSDKILLAFHNV